MSPFLSSVTFPASPFQRSNYFSLGTVSKAYDLVDRHVGMRLRMWLTAKHKKPCRGRKRFLDDATAAELGLHRLRWRKGSFPWATA